MEAMNIGVVGCGGFGLFAMQQFTQVPGVKFAGIAETHREPSILAARRFGVENVESLVELIARDDIDLIYIATPPAFHYSQALAALKAGKHVICEKPLATTVAHAEELVEVARSRGLVMVANLMQPYNRMAAQVAEVLRRKPLGDLLYAHFINCACDEGLSPGHWFWNDELSGGIFIEHGVHFFDLFRGWLGGGEVLSANRNLRPGSGVEETVQCTTRYDGGVLVHFLHSFTQSGRMDRQEFRFVFEQGDLILEEWVPIRARVLGLANEDQIRTLTQIFPGARDDITAFYTGKDREARARFKPVEAAQLFEMHYGVAKKMHVYGELLRLMIADQMAWIANPTHERIVTEANGLESVRMAERATQLART